MRAGSRFRKPPDQNYFISFTDLLIGVLFIFIILLVTYALTYRSAESELREKLKLLEERIEMRSDLLSRLAKNLTQQNVPAVADLDAGVLRLQEGVLFERGRADLNAGARRALTILANELRKELPCYGRQRDHKGCPEKSAPILEAVYIEGHTDDVAINTARFPSNWHLSSERAIVTYNYLRAQSAVLSDVKNASGTAALLGASAYADTRPVRSVENRDENRRIDFRFLLAPPTSADLRQVGAK